MYDKFDITVQGIVNTAFADIIGVPGGSVAAMAKAMKDKLMTPRRPLSVQVGGVELIPSPAGVGFVDAANGPTPMDFSYTQLTNTTFVVSFRVVGHYAATGAGGVISNRWSDTQDIDQMNYTTRTRTGTYVIRSDNPDNKTADQYRKSMACLGVPLGFLRTKSSYTVSPDGLRMQYTIIDREIFKQPPSGAFKASGTYSESTTINGAQRIGIVDLSLEGSKDTPQANLITTALQVCAAKLKTSGKRVGGVSLIKDAKVTIGLYDNTIHVRMTARFKATDKKVQGLAAFNTMNTDTPGSPPNSPSPQAAAYGTCGPLIQAAAYFDPVLKQTLNTATGNLTGSAPLVGQGANSKNV